MKSSTNWVISSWIVLPVYVSLNSTNALFLLIINSIVNYKTIANL